MQKRLIILRSLRIVATPYASILQMLCRCVHTYAFILQTVCRWVHMNIYYDETRWCRSRHINEKRHTYQVWRDSLMWRYARVTSGICTMTWICTMAWICTMTIMNMYSDYEYVLWHEYVPWHEYVLWLSWICTLTMNMYYDVTHWCRSRRMHSNTCHMIRSSESIDMRMYMGWLRLVGSLKL